MIRKLPELLQTASGSIGHDPGIDLELTTVRSGRFAVVMLADTSSAEG